MGAEEDGGADRGAGGGRDGRSSMDEGGESLQGGAVVNNVRENIKWLTEN